MARRATARRGKNKLSMPGFKDVDSASGGAVPEDKYLLEVEEVTQESGDKADYFKWKFVIIENKKYDGRSLFHNTSLSDQSLPFLKHLLECLEYDVPDEPDDIDPKDLVGLTCVGEVFHEEYENRPRAKIGEFYPADELEEAKPARGGKGKKDKEERGRRRGGKNKEEVTEEKIKDMDEDELADFVKENKLDVDLDDYTTLSKKKNATIDAAEKEGILASD